MQTVKLVQGSDAWHSHRARHFNASDAPAMMGESPYTTRGELVKRLATGITPDVDAHTQRIFDNGHRFEGLARSLAEEVIGEELFPATGTEGKYSASFDGLTMAEDVAFEHKTLNASLRAAMQDGCTGADLPLHYRIQMEHQALVSGCERILFMASEWTGDNTLVEERHCWYEPDGFLRAQIVAGWEQLEKDVAAYVPATEPVAPVVAAPIESLPAIAVQLQGSLAVVSNIGKVAEAVHTFIGQMVAKPSTDQEFADAEAECKALKKGEDAMDAAIENAIAQVSDVEAFKRTAQDLKQLMRTTRLAREKIVTAEKDARKTAIVVDAQQELAVHIAAVNEQMGANYLLVPQGIFAPVIKGLKSLESMQDKVRAALAQAIGDANATALRLRTNRDHLEHEDGSWMTLFPDFAVVGTKSAEDFQMLAAHRIGQHKAAEEKRLEAERERIRIEEEAKAAAKVKAEAEAAAVAAPTPSPAVVPLRTVAPAPAPAAPSVNEVPTLKIGAINERLAHFKVTADDLRALGFEPSGKQGPSPLFRESEFPLICRAIAARALELAEQHEAAAVAA